MTQGQAALHVVSLTIAVALGLANLNGIKQAPK
jgi:hypothetical protein